MRPVPLAQGAFYVASGLWPIVHMRSFEAVTGPKREQWLVKAMGGLIAAVGLALIAGARSRPNRALRWLGIGSASALGAADVVFAAKGRIPPIYFADALLESAAIAGWLASG